jgi:hypothetical protein
MIVRRKQTNEHGRPLAERFPDLPSLTPQMARMAARKNINRFQQRQCSELIWNLAARIRAMRPSLKRPAPKARPYAIPIVDDRALQERLLKAGVDFSRDWTQW